MWRCNSIQVQRGENATRNQLHAFMSQSTSEGLALPDGRVPVACLLLMHVGVFAVVSHLASAHTSSHPFFCCVNWRADLPLAVVC